MLSEPAVLVLSPGSVVRRARLGRGRGVVRIPSTPGMYSKVQREYSGSDEFPARRDKAGSTLSQAQISTKERVYSTRDTSTRPPSTPRSTTQNAWLSPPLFPAPPEHPFTEQPARDPLLRPRLHPALLLVPVRDETLGPGHDLLVVLDRRAAGAPVRDAAITSGGALDAVLLADLAALLHDPSAVASVSPSLG